MKYQLIVLIAISLITFSACQEKENPEMKDSTQNVNGTHKVEVVDHMNASNYTYMLVKENESEFWIAAPQTPVEKGEIVYFEKSMVMKNFRSDVLDKTFESILFVQAVSKHHQIINSKLFNHLTLKSVPPQNFKLILNRYQMVRQ
ncbi:MAG: hypothetical protein IPH11_11655 [Ignavibacteriales bacterium]|nr:hypothetical protein [Ignavibacteriales bacterium]